MLKKLSILFATFVLTSLLLVACGGSNNDDEKIVLKAGTNLPAEHEMMKYQIKPMLEEIEKESDGRVEFEVYDSESLVKAGEEFDALEDGTIDIAIPMYDAYDTARFPFAELPLLPVSEASTEIYADATEILYEDEEEYDDGMTHYERTYGEKGLKAWPQTNSPSYTLATTGEPIESMEELQELQIRIPTNVHEIFINNLGASPSDISINETYDAYNRGTLDGSLTPVMDWDSYGFGEVFKYLLYGIHAGSWPSAFTMTDEKFESLPEDIQEIFDEVISEKKNVNTNPELEEGYTEVEEKIVEEFKDNGGKVEEFSDLPQEIQDEFDVAITETWEDWIESMEQDGEPAQEAAIKWRDAIKEAGGEVPEGVEELTED